MMGQEKVRILLLLVQWAEHICSKFSFPLIDVE